MGQINLSRVILGGLAGGVVINVFEGVEYGVLLSNRWSAVMTSLNRAPEFSARQIVAFNLMGFLMGIIVVWLYAALRPRLGAGPKTAVAAALFVWLIGAVLGDGVPVVTHIFPIGLSLIGVGVGLVELVLGALLGAKIYKEEPAGGPLPHSAHA